ncbi:MAG: hypothetical protein Q8P02_00180, partial [Candidatus Micrarchaeota archaeon]|nr:hypothetical protein [Candidatus Micrarchaeota archaeon]
MPVEIPLDCVRRDGHGEVKPGRPKKINLQFIHDPASMPQEWKRNITQDLQSATQSAFRRQTPPQEREIMDRTFGPDVKLLILVKHGGKIKGYYSVGTMTVQPETSNPKNVVFLHASILHKDVKGYGLMNLMQSAGILMGKEYYRIQRGRKGNPQTAHLLAARVQKKDIADRLQKHMGKSNLQDWYAVARHLHPEIAPTP